MRIKLTSVMVDDQDKALKFYTEILGFRKKREVPIGPYKWLTVYAPDGYPDVELSLEPNANPAGKTFQGAMFEQNVPATAEIYTLSPHDALPIPRSARTAAARPR